MNKLHIHEVLRMMIETQKTYTGKEDFIKDITAKFGADTQFYACSSDEMSINGAFDFLINKGKITINNDTEVKLDPNMTMCDDNGHDHHHHH